MLTHDSDKLGPVAKSAIFADDRRGAELQASLEHVVEIEWIVHVQYAYHVVHALLDNGSELALLVACEIRRCH